MGRPIHKKYFGNLSTPPIGGEGISTTVTIGGANDNYTVKPTFTVGSPNLPGGTQAVCAVTSMGIATVTVAGGGTGYTNGDVLTVVGLGAGVAATITVTNALAGVIQAGGVSITTDGAYTTVTGVVGLSTTGSANNDATFDFTLKVNAVTVSNAGSGYTSAPTVQDVPNGNGTFTATLNSGSGGTAIEAEAFVTGGSSKQADIIAQKGSRRYLVETSDGTEICKLVAAAPAAGEMTLTALDSAGGTYYVTKLTAHRAVIVKGGRTGVEFTTGADGISVPWVYGTSATLNTTVEIKSS